MIGPSSVSVPVYGGGIIDGEVHVDICVKLYEEVLGYNESQSIRHCIVSGLDHLFYELEQMKEEE